MDLIGGDGMGSYGHVVRDTSHEDGERLSLEFCGMLNAAAVTMRTGVDLINGPYGFQTGVVGLLHIGYHLPPRMAV